MLVENIVAGSSLSEGATFEYHSQAWQL